MRRPLKVLLIDDHVGFRTVAARLLRTLGHEVSASGDAPEAEALFDQLGPFDVVIMDLLLENGDGVKLAERLAARAPEDLRVLFISGSDVGPACEQPWLKGAHRRFLAKPFTAAALQSELNLLVADLDLG